MSGSCRACGEEDRAVSSVLSHCSKCLKKGEGESRAREAHRESLHSFLLEIPGPEGVPCGQCVNDCRLVEGERGLCGLRVNLEGRVVPALEEEAVVDWYFDPIPTNCVAEWACQANRPEAHGKKNFAVFFHGCSFDCLFCQNWHNKDGILQLRPRRSIQQLLRLIDAEVYCVCFFGGDPTPQLHFALDASERLLGSRNRTPRICWETNGSMSPALAEKMADVTMRSGGTVKFDLKAFDEKLHYALCGARNRQTLDNFRRLSRHLEGLDWGLLVASTLLVPGYVDADEVSLIAGFISELNPDIPYSLLAFHPDYLMSDLPCTSLVDAMRAQEAARRAGLRNVRIGNAHLLR